MSLQTRLAALISAIGADIGGVQHEVQHGKLVNPLALSPWQAALNNHANAPAKMMTIGDSNTEGAGTGWWNCTWPFRTQALLRARKGIGGGVGYVGSAVTTGSVVPALPHSARTSVTESQGGWGLGGRSTQLANASAVLTYNAQTCDRLRVWYGKTNTFGGNFEVRIDGTLVATLSSGSGAGNSDGYYWDSAVLTRGSHVVNFTAPSGWIGIVDGVEFFDGDYGNGIRVYNGGHYGYNTSSFEVATSPNMAMHWQQVAAIAPHLTVIMLGSNDLLLSRTPTQYAASLSALIGYLPAESSVLLLMPPTRGGYQDAPSVAKWQEMRVRAEALAVGNVAFLDLEHWWPQITTDSATHAGLMWDNVHLNTAGLETLAEVLVDRVAAPIRR